MKYGKYLISALLVLLMLAFTACTGDEREKPETGGGSASTPSGEVTEPSEEESSSGDDSDTSTSESEDNVDLPKVEF